MIQDIAPHIFNNSYKAVRPDDNSFFLLYNGREAIVNQQDGLIRFPQLKDLSNHKDEILQQAVYFFSIDDISFFGIPGYNTFPEGFKQTDITIFREGLPAHFSYAGITGFSLTNWYLNHRFCGRCGNGMEPHPAERMLQCPMCKNSEYPKISPAVIVGITNGNKLLLTKYANRAYSNYALIAGFTELGETIEETVQREVLEEAGIKVKNIWYYKSQPWGFTDCLLMGFFADLDGDETITMDKEELAIAEWIERENIEPGNKLSLTGEMIEYFRTQPSYF